MESCRKILLGFSESHHGSETPKGDAKKLLNYLLTDDSFPEPMAWSTSSAA